MMSGKLEPPVSFAGKHARDLQDQSREFRHLVVLMRGERLKTSDILGRDNGLMKEPVQLVASLDAILLFARHSLAFFTDVNAMATPAELLVRTRPTTDSAIMAHALRECYAPWTSARALRWCVGPSLRTSARSL